jgi:5-methylthioribose kinase
MLDVNNFKALKGYLIERNIASAGPAMLIEPLAGGVSNSVLKISCDRGEFVLKQALPKLKVKSEWISDIERTNIEKKALKFLQKILPGVTPKLIYEDEINFLLIMECAPSKSVTWKSLLMKHNCNPDIGKRVGQILGMLHQNTHGLEEAKEMFANKKFFHQLRIEPFFTFLKSKYPDLKYNIEQHIESCLTREDALVTGDYSPKNILVEEDKVMLIDFEISHYGDSSFDLGFLASHLLLKSVFAHNLSNRYYEVLTETIEGYFCRAHFAPRSQSEILAVRQLAWLLLARVDGKSPVEYINREEDKLLIRSAAYEILNCNMKTFQEVIQLFTVKALINENREDSWQASF